MLMFLWLNYYHEFVGMKNRNLLQSMKQKRERINTGYPQQWSCFNGVRLCLYETYSSEQTPQAISQTNRFLKFNTAPNVIHHPKRNPTPYLKRARNSHALSMTRSCEFKLTISCFDEVNQ